MPEDQPQPPARAPTLHIPRRVVPKTGVRPVSDMDAVRDELARFIARHRRIFVLTGAGISTDSGIPDYRDRAGHWKRTSPITHQQFTGDVASRARYWQRSFAGWATIGQAQPNTAHRTLARWQRGFAVPPVPVRWRTCPGGGVVPALGPGARIDPLLPPGAVGAGCPRHPSACACTPCFFVSQS